MAIVDDLIDTAYMVQERPTLSNVQGLINARIVRANVSRLPSEQLKQVSLKALKRRLGIRYSPYEIHCARYGTQSARIKFRTAGAGALASRPLERVAMDHCRLDLFVIDECSGLPLGRPWLTLLQDEFTRYVIGFSLSFEEPSSVSVCQAIAHAITPKSFDHIAEQHRPKQAWDAWGVIETLVVDNGLEFHGRAIEDSAGRLGITIQYCPRKSPWYKGKIERFFRTIGQGLLDLLPGKTFSNHLFKHDYDPAKHAVVSLHAANVLINQWLVDIYHQQHHRGLGTSPAKKWQETIESANRYLPSAATNIKAAMGRNVIRMLSHKGIEFDSLVYNCAELGTVRELFGDRLQVEVVVNDGDLGSIIVISPDGTKIEVPALHASYAKGITRWQHKICRRYQRIKWEEDGKKLELLDAKARIVAFIKEMSAGKSGGRRVAAARFTNGELCGQSEDASTAPPNSTGSESTNPVEGGEGDGPTASSDQSAATTVKDDQESAVTLTSYPTRKRAKK
jgi:putative transposase